MEDFKIGDYVVVEGLPFPQSIHNGVSCEILTSKGGWRVSNKGSNPVDIVDITDAYVTLLSSGITLTVQAPYLKKSKRIVSFKDADTKIAWKDCFWKPQHLRGQI